MMSRKIIILYGSYGYTGTLIAKECQRKNLNVMLAGRKKDALQKQSTETGYPYEVVDLDNDEVLKTLLRKGALVIHCAGPFQFTAEKMINACLETHTHYNDITGEYQVFELLSTFDNRGKQAGITILPGTGFDVVPSDCLALHLKNRLPTATHLQLAFAMSKGELSRGTARTAIEGLGSGSLIRRDGKLMRIPLGEKVMEINFGSFTTRAINIPWGDVSSAWRSTGIPTIEVYMGASNSMICVARLSQHLNWLLRKSGVKNYLKRKIDNRPAGPVEEKRLAGKSFLWGKVWNDTGEERVSLLESASGYTLTARTSVMIAEKILEGNFKSGYQTPAMAYGSDLILSLENTVRTDL
jgi:short subunit dehydrogenase-like uncharacterized protein